VDITYLRAHPQQLPTFLTHQRIRETPVTGGNICTASRLTLDDGNSLFAKSWPASAAHAVPPEYFATEAAGLRWLSAAGSTPVPEVIVTLPQLLVLQWVEPGAPSAGAAERFGRELAGLHLTDPPTAFGAAWPGFIGTLPQDNTPSAGPWGPWFADRRLTPYLRMSVDNDALTAGDIALVERIIAEIDRFGGDEPPARIHGDLWPGNVLWGSDGRGWLIDPAAHGGHRETDLAHLALFGGPPHHQELLTGYAESAADAGQPLREGWQSRVPLHQLHLLLVHTAMFGAAYRDAVRNTARTVLRS